MYRKGLTALCGAALLAFATATLAADELEDVRAKLVELRQRAEQLADEGKRDAAAEVRAHAQKIAREAEEAQAARAREMRERKDNEDRRAKRDRLRGQILELRRAAEQLLEEGKKDRAEHMLARARDLEKVAERGEHVERRERVVRREDERGEDERRERVRAQIRELEVAAERLADEGHRERAQELIARARELRADLEPDQSRDRRIVHRRVVRGEDDGRRHEEIQLPREINQAIEQLREHGNSEIAAALERRAWAMVGERRSRPGGGEPDRDVRGQHRDVARHPEVTEALRQLRADVNKIRENPPTHPEIAHVIRDLRAEVKQMRETLNELRQSVGRERLR